MNNKGDSYWFLMFIIIVLLGALIYFYLGGSGITGNSILNIVKKPSLESSVELDPSFSLTQGCTTKIRGVVRNSGEAIAQSSYITCELHGTSGQNTGRSSLGSLSIGETKSFTITIDNNCPKPTSYTCRSDCSNC